MGNAFPSTGVSDVLFVCCLSVTMVPGPENLGPLEEPALLLNTEPSL